MIRQAVVLLGLAALAVGCASVDDTADDGSAGSDITCGAEGAAVQVLGSGGPIAEADRAGTSYLLWIDGSPRLLIDAGAGSFLRYAQAGGKLETLDAILITHLHADHVGDLAGVLNSGGFENRTSALPVVGPDAAPRFPATSEFLERLLSKESGAFAYNGGYLDGSENKALLTAQDVVTAQGEGEASAIEVSQDFSVTAIPVNHGVAPALGYRIEISGTSFVITGDQSGFSFGFENTLSGSQPDLLFAHHVIHGGDGQPRGLHRTPSQIGTLAAGLEAQNLILTHNMNRSLERLDEGLAAIAESYAGPVQIASDLSCYPLSAQADTRF